MNESYKSEFDYNLIIIISNNAKQDENYESKKNKKEQAQRTVK